MISGARYHLVATSTISAESPRGSLGAHTFCQLWIVLIRFTRDGLESSRQAEITDLELAIGVD
jgi:hypothetical protein